MEKQKSILKKLLYIIIVMMLCWIYNGYNRSLEYLISSADIDWRYIYAKESNVNPLDYRNNTIYNIKRPSIKHTLKLADKKWCEYALSHSINPDDYVCDKIKYDEDNYIFVYKNVNNINTSTYDIMLKRNH
ncbi:MAG: hypothetical protein IJA34_15555 [Lachnospiraceae bacterium]|nr:hypothetical protein [Lachnospiraceae bacterium]